MSVGSSDADIVQMEKRLFEQITTLRKARALRPYGMCKILPNLYLGSIFDATDPEQMDANEITDIICVHGMRQTKYGDKPYNVMYININDSPDENISLYFYDAIEFIHVARLQKRTVLVHCLAGVSRSAVIIAAYLLTVTDLNYSLALTYLTKRRPCANPNFGFRMQLYRFATDSQQSAYKHLVEIFGGRVMERQRKLDHSATIALCDSVTKAELIKLSNECSEGAESENDTAAVKQPFSDGDLTVCSPITTFKDLCYIDD